MEFRYKATHRPLSTDQVDGDVRFMRKHGLEVPSTDQLKRYRSKIDAVIIPSNPNGESTIKTRHCASGCIIKKKAGESEDDEDNEEDDEDEEAGRALNQEALILFYWRIF
jgi:hypothetical protein